MLQEFSAAEARSMPVKKRVMKRRGTGSSGVLTVKNIKKPKCEYMHSWAPSQFYPLEGWLSQTSCGIGGHD
jgi:hypothetical protein